MAAEHDVLEIRSERTAMSRLEVTPALRREILKRFGSECAACETIGELTADVAHLFEDATTHRPRADRLIVLCSNCNQSEARSQSRSKPALLERFDGDVLGDTARRRYRQGQYSRAYGGHRLGAYLFEKQGSYSKAVANLVEAVSALRPIRWGDLLKVEWAERAEGQEKESWGSGE
jgi:hypothetical protein